MEEREILSSWKEISRYLGIAVRTAQRWESELGLPVHRPEKLNKTYVIAFRDEIDAWLQRTTHTKSGKRPLSRVVVPAAVVAGALLVIAVLVVLTEGPLKQEISSVKVEKTRLVAYGQGGKKLWVRDLGPSLDISDYRRPGRENILRRDIDGDGRTNVLVAVQNLNHFDEKVICLDHGGKLLWERKVGREIRFGNKLISPDYDIAILRAEDLDGDSRGETAVVARHKIYFPSRFLLLDTAGRIIGDYWNSGHITSMAFADLDGDGTKEIILGGVNNSFRRAFLAVLELRDVRGCSPHREGSRYASAELEPGTEKAYLLLPPDPVGRAISIQESIKSIDLLNNRRFEITTTMSRIHMEFDFNLNCTDVYLGDEFIERFNRLKKEGRMQIDLNDIDTDRLKAEVLYWNGKGWVRRGSKE